MKHQRSITVLSLATAVATATFAGVALANSSSTTNPINQLLERNAAQQVRIQKDLAAGNIDPLRAAEVEQRAAEVYHQQSQTLAQATGSQQEQLRQAQRDLAGAIAWAEKHPAHARSSAMDRTHLRVESARDAEQQRLIAHEFASGQITTEQAATLEGAQAQIAKEEFDAAAKGHESVAQARKIEGAQNLQDYAIRKDPGLS